MTDEYRRLSGRHFLTITPRGTGVANMFARLSAATYRALGTPDRVAVFVSGDDRGLLVVPDDDGNRVTPATRVFSAAALDTVVHVARTTRYPATITEHGSRPAALVTLEAMSQ